jgi:glycosyltransferase involved in cell wall biosynthesis
MRNCTVFSLQRRWARRQSRLESSRLQNQQARNAVTQLTIVIHCHNRPDYAKCAIESVLRQTNQNFHLVVSDNSTNDDLANLVKIKFPQIDYRRRPPTLPAIEHFNLNIAEADTEFVCLFHDDDLMESDFVDAMLKTIASHPSAVAYSCNAAIIDEYDKATDSCFEADTPYVVIRNTRELAGRYFSRFPNGFAPFPAYIYRTSAVKNKPLNTRSGGKYSDLTWLLELAKTGSIVWNTQKLIRYRIHANNDGGFESARDRLRLLGYLKTNRAFVGQAIIDDYRFFLYKKFCKTGTMNRGFSSSCIAIFQRYLRRYRLKRFFRSETYAYLRYKIAKRLAT